MSESSEEVAAAVQTQLAAYFEHLASRIGRLARTLPPDKLWANPFPFGNSVGHLIVHLTGSLNHFIGANIAGTGYTRNRPAEFSDATARTADELLADFDVTIRMVLHTLASQGAAGLLAPVDFGGKPVQNRFGLFLVCAAHISNHVGQIVYLMHAHGIQFDDKTW